MHVNEAENGVVYLTWPAIEKIEGIRHAFSTRIGGVSKVHLSSMNLSFSRGDDPANVRENYRRFCEAAVSGNHFRAIRTNITCTCSTKNSRI